MKKLLIIFFLITVSLNSYAQLEAKNWYFGYNAGLRFNDTTSSALTNSSMSTYEGCATISSSLGNILFYTDGQTVYDKNHTIMHNGSNLNGHWHSTQSGVIVPHPVNKYLYYIFTVDYEGGSNGFCYSIVDMTRKNGLGSIISKNNLLFKNNVEKITSVKHSDNKSIWVIAPLKGSDTFFVYKISKNGFDTNPIISKTGYELNLYNSSYIGSAGYMKVSPSGQIIAFCAPLKNEVVLFKFNPSIGKVNNKIILNLSSNYGFQPYGIEFSKTGKYLYVSSTSNDEIIQVCLSMFDSSFITNSKKNINPPCSFSNNYSPGALQLGIDGKIYVAQYNSEYLGVISFPDSIGISCQFKKNGIYLNGKMSAFGLPTFIQSYFFIPDFDVKNTCFGDTSKFLISDTSHIDSVLWCFGDSISITNNYSNLMEPGHVFLDTGLYNVSVVLWHDTAATDTLTREIRISPYPTADFYINDTIQCLNGNHFLFSDSSGIVAGNFSWEWDFGDSNNLYIQNPAHSYTFNDTFDVKLTVLSDYGCSASKTKTVFVNPSPTAKISSSDTAQCFGQNNFSFFNPQDSLNPAGSKTWHFGDGNTSNLDTAVYSYLIADTFNVTLIEETNHGCRDTATKNIIVHPSPVTEFSVNDSVQCFNENNFQFTNLTAFQNLLGLNYSWDFGNASTSTDSNGQMKYSSFDTFDVSLVATSTLGCKDSITKQVVILESPKADFSVNDSSQCFSTNYFQFFNLTGFNQAVSLSYFWDFGNDSSSTDSNGQMTYSKFDTFSVQLISTSNLGCADTATKSIFVNQNPKADFSVNDRVQCLNENSFEFFNLTAFQNLLGLNYNWDFGNGTTSTNSNEQMKYSSFDTFDVKLVATSTLGCKDSITKQVVVLESPKADFSVNDSSQCFNENSFQFTNLTAFQNLLGLNYSWDFGNASTS
ncbi:MAG: PKD domain-containing protein, partial [Bacteroidota bacterium]|nr:PKD domain-containing protein [Bacteroidota bacterium]